jgi:AraC family transcriptional regulator of adaptative response / DNA-3-methyladenine glycosylase II
VTPPPTLDPRCQLSIVNCQLLYRALASRDRRFDGVFFVGVTSTGIYCRPVCTAKTPKEANCRFFASAAAAELAGFRPCLRCRPELAPGNAPVDGAERVATRVAARIAEGPLDDGTGVEEIAAEFHMSSRQLRRVVRQELGVAPIDLLLTRRLLLAKQLLTETTLAVTEVAYASGFASLRRFNDSFLGRYGMPPTRLRREASTAAPTAGAGAENECITLRLDYRPPFDWAGLLSFLGARAVRGVEWVGQGEYRRTVRLGDREGWLRVRNDADRHTLRVELTHSLTPVLPALLGRLRHLFDLAARPDVVAEHLARDPRLAPAVAAHPGLRVPGAFDGFELAVRAVLGQQVTVRGASTLAARFVAAFGEAASTPYPELTHHAPTAERVAGLDAGEIAALGIVGRRAACLVAMAEAFASGRVRLHPGADPRLAVERLMALPGVGPWTAQYIAMRALRWPDAFPAGDLVLRRRLGGVTPTRAAGIAEAWRPWRSYATLLLWTDAAATSPALSVATGSAAGARDHAA